MKSYFSYDNEYISGWRYWWRLLLQGVLTPLLGLGIYLQAVTIYKRAKSLNLSDRWALLWAIYGSLIVVLGLSQWGNPNFIAIFTLTRLLFLPVHLYFWFSSGTNDDELKFLIIFWKWLKRNFSFLKNKYFYLHLSLATTTLILLFVGWFKYLDYYTMHDKYIKVPDFNNMLITQVDSIVEANNIKYDTTIIFDRNSKNGVVVSQDPAPFTNVKKDRKIYLTISSLFQEKRKFTAEHDVSLRKAEKELKTLGLEVGELEYVADISDNVLYYKLNGIKIERGQELYVGTIVDLVVGKTFSKESVIAPLN